MGVYSPWEYQFGAWNWLYKAGVYKILENRDGNSIDEATEGPYGPSEYSQSAESFTQSGLLFQQVKCPSSTFLLIRPIEMEFCLRHVGFMY